MSKLSERIRQSRFVLAMPDDPRYGIKDLSADIAIMEYEFSVALEALLDFQKAWSRENVGDETLAIFQRPAVADLLSRHKGGA